MDTKAHKQLSKLSFLSDLNQPLKKRHFSQKLPLNPPELINNVFKHARETSFPSIICNQWVIL